MSSHAGEESPGEGAPVSLSAYRRAIGRDQGPMPPFGRRPLPGGGPIPPVMTREAALARAAMAMRLSDRLELAGDIVTMAGADCAAVAPDWLTDALADINNRLTDIAARVLTPHLGDGEAHT